MNKQRVLAIILIAIVGFACYFNAFSVPFIWDDVALVSDNPLIKDIRYLGRIFSRDVFILASEESAFYRPLQTISYMLDYHIWGLNPFGYHLTNIILHILVAVLVYLFVSSIMYQVSSKRCSNVLHATCDVQHNFISLITVLLFVVHPIHVEAVTYISGRADILMAIFLLSGLIFFIRGSLWLSLFSFIFGLLSKELALIFPLLIVLYSFYFKPQAYKHKRLYFLLLFLLSALYVYLRLNIFPQHAFLAPQATVYKNMPFFLSAPILYLRILFFPVNLHMSYTVILPRSIWEAGVIISILGLISLVFLIIAAFRRAKLVSFALIWFLLLLLPHLGVFPLNAYFAEHFCYLASLGIFFIAAISLAYLIRKNKSWVFLTAITVMAYGLATVRYNVVWQDPARFYERIIKISPGSFTAYNNLGFVEEERGNYLRAEEYYLKAVNMKPDFEIAFINLLRAIYLSGKEDAAIAQMNNFLKKHPASYLGWASLGSMFEHSGRFSEAIEAYQQSIKIKPGIPSTYIFLGRTYSEAQDVESAIKALNSAIALDKQNPLYHNELGLLFKNQGLFEQAVKEYIVALSIEPANAQINLNLGIAYSLMGNLNEAERYMLKAVKLGNNSAIVHYNLGVFYWQKKEYGRAKEEFDLALRFNPDFNQAKVWRDKITGSP